MNKASTIGLDLAKQVFQVHGADATGAVVFRKRLRRTAVLQFFASQAPCRVAMEACASSHYWGRELSRIGHEVRLIPPAYVKPFVKRQKNDAADAEAICEASQRPTMRFVQIKSEAAQAAAVVFRVRDLLVRQRTQIINALRGHLAEFGLVIVDETGSGNQFWTERLERAVVKLTRSLNSHTGPRHVNGRSSRPDTCQHPTTRRAVRKILLAP